MRIKAGMLRKMGVQSPYAQSEPLRGSIGVRQVIPFDEVS